MKLTLALLVGTTLALGASAARANCAMPVGYKTTVSGNTVTICPQDFGKRPCPDADGMLRAGGGGTVKLDDFCGTGNDATCYVDECVPKGTYQYGYAKPFDCCSSCCGTSYYESVSVDTDLPSGCTPSSGNAGPTAFTGTLPWDGKGQTICDYAGMGGAPAGGGAGGQAGSTSSGGQAGSAGTPAKSGGGDDDGGCAVRGLRGPTGAILGFNAAVAALGLLLLARRRRSRT